MPAYPVPRSFTMPDGTQRTFTTSEEKDAAFAMAKAAGQKATANQGLTSGTTQVQSSGNTIMQVGAPRPYDFNPSPLPIPKPSDSNIDPITGLPKSTGTVVPNFDMANQIAANPIVKIPPVSATPKPPATSNFDTSLGSYYGRNAPPPLVVKPVANPTPVTYTPDLSKGLTPDNPFLNSIQNTLTAPYTLTPEQGQQAAGLGSDALSKLIGEALAMTPERKVALEADRLAGTEATSRQGTLDLLGKTGLTGTERGGKIFGENEALLGKTRADVLRETQVSAEAERRKALEGGIASALGYAKLPTEEMAARGQLAVGAAGVKSGADIAAGQLELGWAGLNQDERKMYQEAQKFDNELTFKEWATKGGWDEAAADRVWKSLENDKTIGVEYAKLDVEKQKLYQQASQFKDELSWKTWATQGGWDEETASRVWQSKENDKTIKSNENIAGMRETGDNTRLMATLKSNEGIEAARVELQYSIAKDEKWIKQQGIDLQTAELKGYTDEKGLWHDGSLFLQGKKLGIEADSLELQKKELLGYTDPTTGTVVPGRMQIAWNSLQLATRSQDSKEAADAWGAVIDMAQILAEGEPEVAAAMIRKQATEMEIPVPQLITDQAMADEYLTAAGGDPGQARVLALADNYIFTGKTGMDSPDVGDDSYHPINGNAATKLGGKDVAFWDSSKNDWVRPEIGQYVNFPENVNAPELGYGSLPGGLYQVQQIGEDVYYVDSKDPTKKYKASNSPITKTVNTTTKPSATGFDISGRS